MDSRNAILISGSPRRRGNTDRALRMVDEVLAGAGYKTETVQLSTLTFGSCIACEKCRSAKACTGVIDDLTPVYDSLLAAELWVVGSPVYNYNVTSWMKAFIDRLYCFYDYEDTHPRAWSTRLAGMGKRSIALAVAEQLTDEDVGFALEAMTRPLDALGVPAAGSFLFRGYFGPNALREDAARCTSFAQEVATVVDRL
jgi:NAD(P)H-dependent FMN reductase